MKKTKPPMKETKEFAEEVIQIDRVTRVVKGGRRLRFRATVAIGNKKGKVGVGIGKSTEVTGAIQKAVSQAKKSLIRVPLVEQTIPHRIQVKFKAAKLMLMPACPGTGIIAGGPLRKILELAGVQNVMSKSFGSNNKLSNSQAAILALSKLKQFGWAAGQKKTEEDTEKKATVAAKTTAHAKPAHSPAAPAKKMVTKAPEKK